MVNNNSKTILTATTSRKYRALSNAVVTLILLGVAVVAGGIVATTFLGGAGTAGQKVQLTVQSTDIIVNPNNNTGILTVVLKNDSNRAVTVNSITINTNSGYNGTITWTPNVGSSAITLQPGQFATIQGSFPVGASGTPAFTIGTVYTVTIGGLDTSNNQPLRISNNVTARM
jgi:hypothetical protein